MPGYSVPHSFASASREETTMTADTDIIHQELLEEAQTHLGHLLHFAVQKPDLDLKDEFIGRTIPLLHKNIKDLSPQERIDLWSTYNELSILLYPVTPESLEVAEDLNKDRKNRIRGVKGELQGLLGFLVFFVVLFVLAQGYSLVLEKTITNIDTLDKEYISLKESESTARTAKNDADEKSEPLLSILAKKKMNEDQTVLSARKACELIDFISTCSPKQDAENNASDSAQLQPKVIIETVKAVAALLNVLLLPLLLGFLGAIAYLARNTINQITSNSYIPSWPGRYSMRVLLGGLLGVMGPLLYSSDKIDEIGMNLLLFAFLLGYNVELAFSIFDRLIIYAKDKIKAEPKPLTISSPSNPDSATEAPKPPTNPRPATPTPPDSGANNTG